jgi:hypothetical protein
MDLRGLGGGKGEATAAHLVGGLALMSSVRALSLSWTAEYLHSLLLPPSFFLFLLMAGVAAYMLCVEKVPSHQFPQAKKDVVRMGVYALLTVVAKYLWLEGLRFTGVVRTLLTTDFAELTFLFMLSFLFSFPSSRLPPSKVNGALILTVGYLILCALDPVRERADVRHTWWFGIPENYVGGIALLLSVTLNSALHGMRRSILSDGMDGRVFFTLLHLLGALFLFPSFLYSLLFHSHTIFSSAHVISFSFLLTLALNLALLLLEHRMEAPIYKSLRLSLIALVRLSSSFFFLFFYELVTSTLSITSITFLCFLIILVGMYSLLSTPNALAQDDYLPVKRSAIDVTSSFDFQKIAKFVTHTLQVILSSSDSRNIFFFLLVNLLFMGVEMTYGIYSNSLGLISDAFHMLFDCVALGIGLVASVISKWEANQNFTYGYSRVQVCEKLEMGMNGNWTKKKKNFTR